MKRGLCKPNEQERTPSRVPGEHADGWSSEMNDGIFRPTISVVTATKNAASTIVHLYDSLSRQKYRRFEWVVMDGISDDTTLELLEKFSHESAWLRFRSEADNGIYHALNKAIAVAKGDYYIVAGADDTFDESALSKYAEILEFRHPDVILAKVMRSGRIIGGFHPRRAWLGHSKAFRGSHSIGMLFRKSLHDSFGAYSKRFPMLADGYFLKMLLKSNTDFVDADFIAGTFSDQGLSSISKLQTLVETWQIQMLTERSRLLQTCIFIGKVIYRFPAVLQELKKG